MPSPSVNTLVGKLVIGLPLLISDAAPVKTPMAPSVTISEFSRRRLMTQPFRAPPASPTASAHSSPITVTPHALPEPGSMTLMTYPEAMPDRASIPATERSIPPEIST